MTIISRLNDDTSRTLPASTPFSLAELHMMTTRNRYGYEEKSKSNRAVDARLQALARACRHQFPTADIDVMLDEIEQGYLKHWTAVTIPAPESSA